MEIPLGARPFAGIYEDAEVLMRMLLIITLKKFYSAAILQ
jgi:hypothetical protein